MHVCFFGTPHAAVPALEAFLTDPAVRVAAAVCNPDRPAGRGHRLAPPPVKVAARQAGVQVWQPRRAADIIADLRAAEVDACAVVAYGALLPRAVLDAGGLGFVNLHFSLLPAWRGPAPVQHTLLHGDTTTGVTCFVLDEGMDTGPILETVATPVARGETAGELLRRLAELGAPALLRAVRGLVDGTSTPRPQQGPASYAPKITSHHARIDWTAPADAIERAVRAFNPLPGAHTELDGRRVKVHEAQVIAADGPPGAVVDVLATGPVVACGRDGLVLTRVQPAGKPAMDGRAFANGYRPAGRRLGAPTG